jgi:hypothetical protein
MLKVKCKQIVENDDLSDPDDRAEFALGKNGIHDGILPSSLTTATEALDYFHDHNAIGCLDDYEIWVEDINGNRVEEE